MLIIKLFFDLFKATLGYFYWHYLTRRSKLKNNAVVLIPEKNEEYTEYAMKYLDKMLAYNSLDKVLVLSVDKKAKEKRNYSNNIIAVKKISRMKASCLLSFYNANMSDARFFVASLEKPEGRNALNYLRTNKISKEELFQIAIYNILDNVELIME